VARARNLALLPPRTGAAMDADAPPCAAVLRADGKNAAMISPRRATGPRGA